MTRSRSRRFAHSALLLLGSAVLAAVVVAVTTPRFAGAHVPPADVLPWPREVSGPVALPMALLYVQSGCAHCSRAAVLVDSILGGRRVRTVIASNENRTTAAAYRRKLALRLPIAFDSSATLIHAIGSRSVPTLVLFHRDGSRQLVVGFTSDERYRRLLDSFAR